MWVKCYLNRRKLQHLLASAELPSEHPLEEQIKNSVKKKISVEQKMFRRDFLCLQSLRCNAIIKETGEAFLNMQCIAYILQQEYWKNVSTKQQEIKQMELWDIYDKNKKPTGRTMKRNDWHLKDGEYHLTVLGVVARPDQTFLITKRVMTKAWAPGWWEVSGGAAQAGEESYEAVLREVKEETGLDAGNAEGGYLFTYKRENPGEGDNYFVDVYRFVMDIDDKDLHLQTEETDGYMFATPDQIREFAEQGIFLHYDSIKQAFEM